MNDIHWYIRPVIIISGLLLLSYCKPTNNKQVLNKYFFTQNNKVYYKNPASNNKQVLLQGANPEHFRLLPDTAGKIPEEITPYAADCMNVYYKNSRLEGCLPDRFQVLGNGFARDDEKVFFKDKTLAGVTAKEFKVLGNFYGKDKSALWFGKQTVKGNFNLSELTVIDGYFSKDANTVFMNNKNRLQALPGVSPDEFRKLRNIKHELYAAYTDKEKVYLVNKNLPENADDYLMCIRAEAETFSILSPFFFKDSSCVFFKEKRIPGADPAGFQVLSTNYAKDSRQVYHKNCSLPEAHAASFTIRKSKKSDAADQKNIYMKGKILQPDTSKE